MSLITNRCNNEPLLKVSEILYQKYVFTNDPIGHQISGLG